jgi:hypothetical protein
MNAAFFRRHQTMTSGQKEAPDSWLYVGRFIWGFGMIESMANTLFSQLFDLRGLLYLLLLANLDLRKKMSMMEVGFKHQGVRDHLPVLGQVHKLADVRNVIAHGSFYDEPDYGGIIFDDYVHKTGELRLPHKRKSVSDDIDENRLITFAEFDKYDEEAAAIYDYLCNLDGFLIPITDFPVTLQNEINEVLRSGNVIPFPKGPLPRLETS